MPPCNSGMRQGPKTTSSEQNARLLKQSQDAAPPQPRRRTWEMNKLMAVYLFALLNIIVVYAMVAMWRSGDYSYLEVLITDIGAQVLTYVVYCAKAYFGKKQEEKMKFEREHEEHEWLARECATEHTLDDDCASNAGDDEPALDPHDDTSIGG